jgi:hypothetical protein
MVKVSVRIRFKVRVNGGECWGQVRVYGGNVVEVNIVLIRCQL